jgi:hypothetical protein
MSTRRAVLALVFFCFFGLARPAAAYPWLIEHGYTSCVTCHVDPSGAGQLTAYGHGMSDVLVRWHWDPHDLDSGEASPTSGFLFGLVPLPEWLNISGNLRGGGMVTASNVAANNTKVAAFPLLMATDAYATVSFEPFVAHVSVGYGFRRVGPAVVISPDSGPDNALISREHWAGFQFLENSLMLRAGRMNLPFGLRNNEHPSFVRNATRTDIDTHGQHGIAVSYANEVVRTEVMAIAGNYQVRPDEVRERGYSGYVEVVPAERLAIGASSLMTFAARDINLNVPNLRHAHGIFARYAPAEQVSFLLEADSLFTHSDTSLGKLTAGGTGWLQVDYQPIQGVHLMPAVEALYIGDGTESLPTVGAWATAVWYVLPHTELRVDATYRQAFPSAGASSGTFTGVLQLHLWL